MLMYQLALPIVNGASLSGTHSCGHVATMPIEQFERPVGGDESEADSGVVRFETEGSRLTKVSARSLSYSPRHKEAAEQEEARVRARLQHDLEQYRAFLLQRCDDTRCRTVWQEGPRRGVFDRHSHGMDDAVPGRRSRGCAPGDCFALADRKSA